MKLLAAGLLVALGGCAATGTPYKEHPAYTDPVPADLGRVVVYRMDRAHNSTVAATVNIDGAVIGKLRESGFVTRDIARGAHTLKVDIATEAGSCQLPFRMVEGETGYFLVAPRSENAAARTPGSIVGALAPTWLSLLVSEVAVEASAAAESVGKQCGGPFSVVRTLPNVAQAMVMDLRESSK